VGVEDAFKYCTALNRLTSDPERRVRVGDLTLIFWADAPTPFESDFLGIVSDQPEDDEAVTHARATLKALRKGQAISNINPQTTFHILGISPNAARLSIRLWISDSIGVLSARLAQHLDDLHLEDSPEGCSLSIRRLVLETAPPKSGWADEERISPVLAGEVLRAILTGRPYPRALLSAVISRCRVEGLAISDDGASRHRKDWRHAQHRRCAIIKACLTREARATGRKLEIPVSLNESHANQAYQLGRLFAAIERAQESALGHDLNSTVKDRYFGAACATPASVFPRLIRMHQHHAAKLDGGIRVNNEKLMQSICDHIQSFPPHLGLEEQGLFTLGYYHQRQDFFRKPAEAAAAIAD
ncbi:MAG: type I-C CRISPR-associated protein Cas8c/Csd1, partial [Phycisphaerales bacterium]|nr:type I-C CRISPR-associated protein Cas8c/Csd1 [Phycisphaerales bacterium]